MKKVKDMTDEEIELEFDRQYKRDYLLAKEQEEKRRKRFIILLLIFGTLAAISFIKINTGLNTVGMP